MIPKEEKKNNFKIDESEYYKVKCTDLLKICLRIQQIGSGYNPVRVFYRIKPMGSRCSDNLMLNDQVNFVLAQ